MTTLEVIATVATAVITIAQVIDRVWSKKASREAKIKQVAGQVYLMVEGLAKAGKLGPEMSKAAAYAMEIRRLLSAMGEHAPTKTEWRYFEEYARVRSNADRVSLNGVKK